MLRGDISNEIAPKLFFIIEDLLVTFERPDRVERRVRRKDWDRLARETQIDGQLVAHLWDLVWRTPYSHELITLTSDHEDWLDALQMRFERFNVPHSGLLGFDGPDRLAQNLVFMPNVLRLYHGREEWRFRFGPLGELVSDFRVISF